MMTDTELLKAIRGIIKEEVGATIEPFKVEVVNIIEPFKAEIINIIEPLKADVASINDKLEIIEEKLEDMDNAVGIITDWIEKAADHNRVPFLKAE